MKNELLTNYIRVRVTDTDRKFIENHTIQTGQSISDLLRDLIAKLRAVST